VAEARAAGPPGRIVGMHLDQALPPWVSASRVAREQEHLTGDPRQGQQPVVMVAR
jgi:hypothetical protein